LKKALAITIELQDESQMVDAALSLAWLLAAEGKAEKALELGFLVEHHPAGTPAVRERASQLAAELAHQMPEGTFQRIERRTRDRTLESILAQRYLL